MRSGKFFEGGLMVAAVLMFMVTPVILACLVRSQPSWSIGQYLAFTMIMWVFWSIAYLLPRLLRQHQASDNESV